MSEFFSLCDAGKAVIASFSRQQSKCALISSWLNFSAVGSIPAHNAVEFAIA